MIQPFFSVIACCDFPRKIKIMEARFLAMAPCAQDGGGLEFRGFLSTAISPVAALALVW